MILGCLKDVLEELFEAFWCVKACKNTLNILIVRNSNHNLMNEPLYTFFLCKPPQISSNDHTTIEFQRKHFPSFHIKALQRKRKKFPKFNSANIEIQFSICLHGNLAIFFSFVHMNSFINQIPKKLYNFPQ